MGCASIIKRVKLKTFLTTFKLPDGDYGWEIKAKDWAEAKMICKKIKHKLDGEKIRV